MKEIVVPLSVLSLKADSEFAIWRSSRALSDTVLLESVLLLLEEYRRMPHQLFESMLLESVL
uniref:Uncharacterized protein n=1 Tax=Candidatus Methanogaster sp. ANME-2c ERB4 TaxID=2759911 RepID=A0A7G9YQP5_9EURY|nr:hypothetical protein DDMMJHKH_00002 [Methanosarcinales archaeon ANME-2c ERB4]